MSSRYFPMLSIICLLFPISASADFYLVNSSIGVGGVTGTIETDGTLGVLTAANILNWELTLTDSSGSFDLLGPNSGDNSGVEIFGIDFTATSTDLLFDFSQAAGSVVLFQNPFPGSAINYWCLDDTNATCSGNPSGETVGLQQASQQFEMRSGVSSVATRAVPEPGAFMFSTLVVSAGLIRRRR